MVIEELLDCAKFNIVIVNNIAKRLEDAYDEVISEFYETMLKTSILECIKNCILLLEKKLTPYVNLLNNVRCVLYGKKIV